ncbi:gap junction beta-7 protein isoform X2 [Talpa occidentalis]|uniref:gap junction beta-7 protein isoform X2 n=1 Tax=Talpa occidentalis TaxID=50954 RepID=UPI0018901D1B|nr:gap junction beta-7 protein isoform X2 [Talpa occidentalis]
MSAVNFSTANWPVFTDDDTGICQIFSNNRDMSCQQKLLPGSLEINDSCTPRTSSVPDKLEKTGHPIEEVLEDSCFSSTVFLL